MIVPDGRTNLEKLRELLGNPEETHLDLKAVLKLSDSEARAELRQKCRHDVESSTGRLHLDRRR